MSFFDENITDIKQLTKVYKHLCKQYHPDNLETGDKNKFIEIKNEYDLLKAKMIKNKTIFLTIEQAYSGCLIKYRNSSITIPKHFYRANLSIGNEKVSIKIKSSKKEKVFYDKNNNIILKKVLDIDIFDVILGFKDILILGENRRISIKNLNTKYVFKNWGYPKRNSDERGDLIIALNFHNNIIISDEDKQIIERLKEKYAKEKIF